MIADETDEGISYGLTRHLAKQCQNMLQNDS